MEVRCCLRAASPFRRVEKMMMTMAKRLCLLAAVLVPGLALADEATAQAQSLASSEAILEHCARLNPAAADQYREQAKLLTQGASEETLAKLRKTEDYRVTHDQTVESLAKVDEREAIQACEQRPAQGQ
jgi:hypothetical protein